MTHNRYINHYQKQRILSMKKIKSNCRNWIYNIEIVIGGWAWVGSKCFGGRVECKALHRKWDRRNQRWNRSGFLTTGTGTGQTGPDRLVTGTGSISGRNDVETRGEFPRRFSDVSFRRRAYIPVSVCLSVSVRREWWVQYSHPHTRLCFYILKSTPMYICFSR
jgi:hypothetical protein